jgi:hypothetical protein
MQAQIHDRNLIVAQWRAPRSEVVHCFDELVVVHSDPVVEGLPPTGSSRSNVARPVAVNLMRTFSPARVRYRQRIPDNLLTAGSRTADGVCALQGLDPDHYNGAGEM